MRNLITRFTPLTDETVDVTGRTVTAYAAVFDVEQDIRDVEGEYREVLDRAAFNKTISDNGSFPVFYNHGSTIQGAPSELYSMPLGRGTATVDSRGVLTETKYTNTRVADEVLENIKAGVIRGQSFSGAPVRSAPERPARGGYRRTASGLTLVRRHEIRMKEFGPTPFPYYPSATIEGVRSLTGLRTLEALLNDGTITESMPDEEIAAAVRAALTTTSSGEPADRNATSTEAGADQRSAAARIHMRSRLTERGLRHGQGLPVG